jgi:hypothetical protein
MYVIMMERDYSIRTSGKKQFLKVSRDLIDLKTGNRNDEFPRAVEKCRHYILGYNPMVVIITRLDSALQRYR